MQLIALIGDALDILKRHVLGCPNGVHSSEITPVEMNFLGFAAVGIRQGRHCLARLLPTGGRSGRKRLFWRQKPVGLELVLKGKYDIGSFVDS